MDPLLEPMEDADRREVGGVVVEIVKVGNGRVKRAIYPPGFRWSTHMAPVVRSERCLHAHIGFLARGHIQGEYEDGCTFDYTAPQVVANALKHGVMLRPLPGDVVGICPPLIIKEAEIDQLFDRLEAGLNDSLGAMPLAA